MSETTPTLGPPRARGEEHARKWRKRRSRLRRRLRRAGDVALVLLAIFAIGFGLERAHSGGGKPSATTYAPGSLDARYPPMKDITLTGCAYQKNLFAGGVTMLVVNHTPTPWTYYVDVRWNDGSKRFTETVLHSKRVTGYHSIRMGGFGLAPNHGPPRHLTCVIRSVTRAPV